MKAHILMPVAAQAGHPQDLAVCARAPPLDEFGKLAADHEAYDLAIGQLGRGSDRDELAIAQDGHAITQPQDFLDAVGYVDDRHPFIAQPADQREQALHLFIGQR